MNNKKIVLLILLITCLLNGCRVKIGDATIICNQITGECEVVGIDDGYNNGEGSSSTTDYNNNNNNNNNNNYITHDLTPGVFVPDEGTLSISKCGSYHASNKGIFKGFYYNDSDPNSTADRWSMKACGTSSFLTTIRVKCTDGREYKKEVNKLAKTVFEKALQGICQITTTGIDGIVYAPSEVEVGGTYVSRFVTNTKTPTLHSYGIAVDINSSKNYVINGVTYKSVYGRDIEKYQKFVDALDSEADPRNVNYILYVKIFQPLGFDWGRNWSGKSYDGMHFEIDWKQTKK